MAKITDTIDKNELKADISALRKAKTDFEVKAIMAKYDSALKSMDRSNKRAAEKAAEEERLAKEAERKAKAKARREAKKQAELEAKKAEEERLAKEAEKKAAAKAKREEKKRLAAEEARKAEEERIAREKAEAEAAEKARLEAEAAEKARLEEEARKAEEERIAREKAEAEAAEKARLEAEAAEKARLEEEARKAEEERIAKEKAEAEAAKKQKKAPAKKTPAPVAAEATGKGYSGKYEVYQAGDGFAYTLKASNGQKLVESEIYKSRDGVLKAIDAIKKNVEDGDIKVFADKHGKHKFKLIAKNHRILVISANYDTDDRAVKASESFKKFALQAVIVDVEVKDSDVMTDIVIEKTEDKTGGKYIIEEFNGEYSWDLKATNGQILCQKDGYTSKKNCLDAIENFKTYVETGSFKLTTDKRDHSYYKLYTPSGRVFVAGEAYTSKSQAESAANSVASFYKLAEIVEDKPVVTEEAKPAKKTAKKSA